MASVSSSSDLQQVIPVRPTRPIAPRQQPQQDPQQQDQIVDKNNQAAVTSDEEIERAVRAFEQDRKQKQQFVSNNARDIVLENDIEQFGSTGYDPSGTANAGASPSNGRGQYIDIYA